ncbi:hypothetical protein SCHPADRAFT_1003058 [Schizopora paradoxa]|uniref:Histone chaperone domain-containing protein n=1 Tax=Schizopora paradoxa TaxID=27342 RepID=A0A0H2R088_9AGAM|nr:hypothetical protein SCHPADRAFT_1003058 [Schizopora paradoxa]
MSDDAATAKPPSSRGAAEKNGETTQAAPSVDQKGKGKRTATDAELEEAKPSKEKAKGKAVEEDDDEDEDDSDEEEEDGEGEDDSEEDEEEELGAMDMGNIRASRTRQRKPINYASEEALAAAGLTRKELDEDDD